MFSRRLPASLALAQPGTSLSYLRGSFGLLLLLMTHVHFSTGLGVASTATYGVTQPLLSTRLPFLQKVPFTAESPSPKPDLSPFPNQI